MCAWRSTYVALLSLDAHEVRRNCGSSSGGRDYYAIFRCLCHTNLRNILYRPWSSSCASLPVSIVQLSHLLDTLFVVRVGVARVPVQNETRCSKCWSCRLCTPPHRCNRLSCSRTKTLSGGGSVNMEAASTTILFGQVMLQDC